MENSNLQNQLTTLLSSLSSLVIVIPSLVQSLDPNMILTTILEIRNNYELLVQMLSCLSDELQHLAKYLAMFFRGSH